MPKQQKKIIYNSKILDRVALYEKLNVKQKHKEKETDSIETFNKEAFYDKLTHLPNQHLLYDRLGQEMASSKRIGHYMALMYISLTDFQSVYDYFNQEIGNLLLIEVASRLKDCVREVDTVARTSTNDNFIVMLNELTREKTQSVTQTHIIAEKIHTVLTKPFTIIVKNEKTEDITNECNFSINMGVVVFTNNNMSRDSVLEWAEKSMYKARTSGGSQICFSDTYI